MSKVIRVGTPRKRINLIGLMAAMAATPMQEATKMFQGFSPSRFNCGRKRFGLGTAKNYNDRVSAKGWNHYSDRADENGWNAVGKVTNA
jgi:hypothetical protein